MCCREPLVVNLNNNNFYETFKSSKIDFKEEFNKKNPFPGHLIHREGNATRRIDILKICKKIIL